MITIREAASRSLVYSWFPSRPGVTESSQKRLPKKLKVRAIRALADFLISLHKTARTWLWLDPLPVRVSQEAKTILFFLWPDLVKFWFVYYFYHVKVIKVGHRQCQGPHQVEVYKTKAVTKPSACTSPAPECNEVSEWEHVQSPSEPVSCVASVYIMGQLLETQQRISVAFMG